MAVVCELKFELRGGVAEKKLRESALTISHVKTLFVNNFEFQSSFFLLLYSIQVKDSIFFEILFLFPNVFLFFPSNPI